MTRGSSRERLAAAAGFAAVLLLGAPRLASAQDVRVVVKVDLTSVQQELTRLAHETLPAIGDDIRDALRDVADGLDDLGTSRTRSRQQRSARAEQTDSSTQPLAIGPTGTLDVSVTNGSITVTGGSGAPTVQVIKKARGRTDAEARQAMDRVTVRAEVRGGRVHLEPSFNDRMDVDVSLVVTAPAGIAVNARTTNGPVTITGIRGDVSVHTMNGAITLTNVPNLSEAHSYNGAITVSDTQTDRALAAESLSGPITFRQVKARRITAISTTAGAIMADGVECGEALLKSLNGTVTFRGPMARNGHYELHSFNGVVRFEPTGAAGFELDASSYNGAIRVNPPIRLQSTRTDRHTLAGTWGDGAATVTLETFSGLIVIGKS